MANTREFDGVARRELTVFYVLDTSGSMVGTPIATLNRAMEETVEVLKEQAKKNADALLKIAVMEFNSGCRWVQPVGPEDMEDFFWENLEAGGITDVGAALNELDSKLSRNEFLDSMTGAYMPIIIFMTDGYATDDYEKSVKKIRQNKWFLRATKIGFAIGDNPDTNMVCDVVGNKEAVVRTNDLQNFAKLLKFASVTSTMLVSKSRTSEENIDGSTILAGAKKESEKEIDLINDSESGNLEPESAVEPMPVDTTDGWPDYKEWK